MRKHRQSYSVSFIGIAAIVLLFFCGTLTASLRVAPPVPPRVHAATSVFTAVTPPATDVASCACISCGAHDTPGTEKCCCAGAETAGEALVFRAVCDTPPDTALTGSPLPQTVLPRTASVCLPVAFPAILAARIAAPKSRPGNGSPLPPDAPPRSS